MQSEPRPKKFFLSSFLSVVPNTNLIKLKNLKLHKNTLLKNFLVADVSIKNDDLFL